MPAGAGMLAAAYPFPSFKFGYSLTAALLTWPLENALFERTVPRLSAVNLFLGALTLVLIFAILYSMTGTLSIPASASVFYIFDVYNIHNNYIYQSHTLAGLFYVLLALFLFLRVPRVGFGRFFIVANLLFFSLLTSSHAVLLAVALGGLMFVWVCTQAHSWRERTKYVVAGSLGVAAWPAYIATVEILLDFKKRGLPSYHEQFMNYGDTVSKLIDTYPALQRQLWDLRLWNAMIVILVVATIVAGVLSLRGERQARPKEGTCREAGLQWLLARWQDRTLLFPLAALVAFAGTAFYSQPIVRAIVPHLLVLDLFLGCLVGYAIARIPRVAPWITVLIAGCVVGNFYLYMSVIKKEGGGDRYVTMPVTRVKC
jgi:hypothetical protein